MTLPAKRRERSGWNQHMGKRVRRYREQLGLTQRELADLLHIEDHTTITRIESGTTTLAMEKAALFCRLFGLRLDDFVGHGAPPPAALAHLTALATQLPEAGVQVLVDLARVLVRWMPPGQEEAP